MNSKTPHIITEGGLEYQLGKLKGNQIIYDFDKILIFLEAKGKSLFGQGFKIYEEDLDMLYKLSNYQIRNYQVCKKLGIDIKKGILLSGPVGCGKSSVMKLMRSITPHYTPYEIIATRTTTFAFNHIGYRIIEQYGDGRFYCFDDLGMEPHGRHFGMDCNVMGEILLSRYDLFFNYKLRTHGTTSLTADELELFYGSHVRSRMRKLFNLIAYDKDNLDKR